MGGFKNPLNTYSKKFENQTKELEIQTKKYLNNNNVSIREHLILRIGVRGDERK